MKIKPVLVAGAFAALAFIGLSRAAHADHVHTADCGHAGYYDDQSSYTVDGYAHPTYSPYSYPSSYSGYSGYSGYSPTVYSVPSYPAYGYTYTAPTYYVAPRPRYVAPRRYLPVRRTYVRPHYSTGVRLGFHFVWP